MPRGRLYVGTSGFGYKEWKGSFYPPKLKPPEMLRYYAERLSSVEVNNTFYRMPTEKLVAGWRDDTPESFVFTLKAPQRITHVARLRDVGEDVAHFAAIASTLGPRLGCLFFQCPPTLRYAPDLLDGFLGVLPEGRVAMEFRHASWSDDAVRRKLADRGVAWCVAETDEADADVVRTAPFVYLRLRRLDYDDGRLRSWADRLRPVVDAGGDAYVYFKHEDDPSGVKWALRLRELVQ